MHVAFTVEISHLQFFLEDLINLAMTVTSFMGDLFLLARLTLLRKTFGFSLCPVTAKPCDFHRSRIVPMLLHTCCYCELFLAQLALDFTAPLELTLAFFLRWLNGLHDCHSTFFAGLFTCAEILKLSAAFSSRHTWVVSVEICFTILGWKVEVCHIQVFLS